MLLLFFVIFGACVYELRKKKEEDGIVRVTGKRAIEDSHGPLRAVDWLSPPMRRLTQVLL
jgi:hypothetical protein